MDDGRWTMDDDTHHAAGKGTDPSEMGRWTWVRIKGRNNMYTRIYSIYRPCKSHGPHTTYTQQVNALNETQDLRCPQTAMMEDLSTEILAAQQLGEQIIIGRDFNMNIATRLTDRYENLDLKNAIFEHHGEDGPTTFEAGRDQIDGIIISSTIQVR